VSKKKGSDRPSNFFFSLSQLSQQSWQSLLVASRVRDAAATEFFFGRHRTVAVRAVPLVVYVLSVTSGLVAFSAKRITFFRVATC
jgi:hypothetical protein